jgi:valyl-tRNA synthetase
MFENLDKVYDPKKVEDKWYQVWLDRNYFHAEVRPDKESYTIVIPPPNVTDRLHMGHAYNNTLQDILIRMKRMQGYEALWVPGTDHAGIATQNVVERDLLNREGKSRHDLGREEFVRRVWEWKEKYGDIIIEQLKKIGCSCDWQRTRFTMDEGLSRAVLEVFVRLYNKGLIYRGSYIVNWCPRCQTALSDDEVEHREQEGHLWYIKYPVKGSKRYVTVATTRPETMLGDTGVAVHPEDARYKGLIGKTILLPLMNREIPIVADDLVDPKFGTGAVKVTPAHDPNDFVIAERHSLEPLKVMDVDGSMNEAAGKYAGMDRFQARKAVVKDLKQLGLLEKIEPHTHAVGHCYRCHTLIEPYLSEQWFVKIKPLAEPALRVALDRTVRFHPERWTKVYVNWLENVRDWCISRQLWWGHRIPVYFCQDCGHMMVSVNAVATCEKCGSSNIEQDPDVLDTWFSSWLWPFSTLGWPEQTPDLDYFYPTKTLVTGHEIIFFWVARMIMAGLEFTGKVPFYDVYLHGIIRDAQGRKMSKSLGNGIDPLDMVSQYSADAVRFSLLILSSEGNDINLSESDFEIGRNFSNKLWNAFRFLAMNLRQGDLELGRMEEVNRLRDQGALELADRWILSRYHRVVREVTENLDQFRFHEAVSSLYSYFWHEYCDWYLEVIKPRLYEGADETGRRAAVAVALTVLKGLAHLLHPFVPFITEEIFQQVRLEDESESIVISSWPESDSSYFDASAEDQMKLLQDLIGAIRNIRGEMNVPPNKRADVLIKSGDPEVLRLVEENRPYLEHLAKVQQLTASPSLAKPKKSASAVVNGFEVYVPLEGLIDIAVERSRLEKEIRRLEETLENLDRRLQSLEFRSKAPKEVVEREERKKQDFEANLEKLRSNLASLEE